MNLSNSADAYQMHQKMMKMTGVWPVEASGILYRLKAAFSWTLGITLALTMLMEVNKDITDFTQLSEILYITMSEIIYLVKLMGFTYQRETFLGMIHFLKDPIFLSYPGNLDHYMRKTLKISYYISNGYRYLCLSCMLLFAVFPFLDNKALIFPFPYDVGNYRFLMYAFQWIGICNSAWNNSCLDTLAVSLMGLGAAQLDILADKIISLTENDEGKREIAPERQQIVKKQLKQCVQHHLAIIKFIESIEKVFTIGFLAQFLASIMVLCNTLFNFVLIPPKSSKFFMLANYFAIMITQLSTYCWFGNEIMLKSLRVGQACYLFNWYEYNAKVGQYVFLIMERSKRPLVITALKFSSLSLRTLAAILQWSYSYLALLLKMYNKKSPSGY